MELSTVIELVKGCDNIDQAVEQLEAAKAEQDANTVSSSDPCEPPERKLQMKCNADDPDVYKVPVQLVDGPCDGQEYDVADDADHFVAVSGSDDGFPERQKYVWELDDNGERKYHNDTRNPGKGIYWMRWDEWLG